MIEEFTVRGFKSLEDVTLSLGQVNVFIGANGSGKSNLLEAIGVLSAAADGEVSDRRLIERGVRPGVPKLYLTAFRPRVGSAGLAHSLFLSARNPDANRANNPIAAYDVTLQNTLEDPRQAWRYEDEHWAEGDFVRVDRSAEPKGRLNDEQGLAFSKVFRFRTESPASRLLKELQEYAIWTPTTPVLRGSVEDQSHRPIGLAGGGINMAVALTFPNNRPDENKRVRTDAKHLIDWCEGFGAGTVGYFPLSPAAAANPFVMGFEDGFMAQGRNVVSAYDASEGALYVLFMAVLAANETSPAIFAVDNADHGLNPILARELMARFSDWILTSPRPRQVFLTTHSPLSLDGLPLNDEKERVRLFTVDRDTDGRTVVQRIALDEATARWKEKGLTLSRQWTTGCLGGVPDV